MRLLLPVLMLVACAATSNPDLAAVEAVAVTPPVQAAEVEPQAGDEDGAGETAKSAPASRNVGAVGGEAITVEDFLSRLWMRDSGRTREVLEQIVFERLTLLEAERLGLAVAPEAVEEVLADAYASMGAKLAEAGSKLSVTEHIRQVLEMDPAFYEGHLRSDAIVQLLAERCVRAWALESERAIVDVLEVADEDGLDAVSAGLAADVPFEELAAEYGSKREPGGLARISLVRAESHALARLAFATAPGQIGGPLVQGPGYLLLRVQEHRKPQPFQPGSAQQRLEASLLDTPVDNLEFVQWRAAMVRRYPVDLAPFFDLVGDRGPQ